MNAALLISNAELLIFLVSIQNDGPALKNSIQFDEKLHLNVGLKTPVTYDFVQENQNPTPQFLKNNIVCEANISYVSTMDDCVSLPVAGSYKTNYNKTGNDRKSNSSQKLKSLKHAKIVYSCLMHRTTF